jgi:MATE family multidrug resistance protein
MRPYFLTLLVSIPFMQLFYGYKQFSEGVTDTATPMWIMLLGNLINIIGNYILIFGKCGSPALGLTGAGLATLGSRVFMLFGMVAIFNHKKSYSTFKQEFQKAKITLNGFKQLNRLGLPLSLQMGMETASFSLSAVMMGWIGATALAAHQILCSVGTLCFMIYYGIGAAVTIRESRFYGERDMTEVRRTSFAGFHLILICGTIATTAIFLFRHKIGFMFTDDAAVNAMTAALVIPCIFYQFGDGLQCCYANALRGIEDVKIMMLHAFIAYVVISLPASYIFAFPLGYGAVGVWMGFPFGLTSAGLLFLLRFLKQTKTA